MRALAVLAREGPSAKLTDLDKKSDSTFLPADLKLDLTARDTERKPLRYPA
jgi:hypothetical protein